MATEKERQYKREWAAKNKDFLKAKRKAYAEANQELIKERQRNYYIKNKDKILARVKSYTEANKDHIYEYKHQWTEANKDRIAKENRAWRETKEGKIQSLWFDARTNAKEAGTLGQFTLTQEDIAKKLENGVCQVTGIPFEYGSLSLDRRNPWGPSIDRITNGAYTNADTQAVCWAYNNMKADMNREELTLLIAKSLIAHNLATLTQDYASFLMGRPNFNNYLHDRKVRQKLAASKRKAKLRSSYISNGEFELSFNDLLNRVAIGKCEVTGIPFLMSAEFSRQNPWKPSPDRIDNNRGYTKDNIQIVCWAYNRAKAEWSSGEFNILLLGAAKGLGII